MVEDYGQDASLSKVKPIYICLTISCIILTLANIGRSLLLSKFTASREGGTMMEDFMTVSVVKIVIQTLLILMHPNLIIFD